MKIKLLILIMLVFLSCKNKNIYMVDLLPNYKIYWDNENKWILKDKNYLKISENVKFIQPKLIQLLKDTTPVTSVCFKDKPLRKGDVALICLYEFCESSNIYDPNMIEIKRLNKSDPCFFILFNQLRHLEKNRESYSNFLMQKYK